MKINRPWNLTYRGEDILGPRDGDTQGLLSTLQNQRNSLTSDTVKKEIQMTVDPLGKTSPWFTTHSGYPFVCAGQTDIGRRRKSNQDQFFIADMHKNMSVQSTSLSQTQDNLFGDSLGKLMLVADGMGGENAGEIASEMAVTNLVHFLLNSMHWLNHPTESEVRTFIQDLKSAANFSHQMVSKNAENEPEHHGMGSTLTVAYLISPMLYVLHVGDSRCYVLQKGRLQKLTRDQTLAQELADLGYYGEKGVADSPYQNVLVSAIGIQGEPQILVYRTELRPGDRILLCSDGLNAHLSDSEIAEVLSMSATPEAICSQLIELTNERGGRDNTTVVVGICEPVD